MSEHQSFYDWLVATIAKLEKMEEESSNEEHR
jgi:hypothetical protein